MERWTIGMRDAFSESLYAHAKKDKDIVLITSDTGAICHDRFRQEIGRQYYNVGIAEQNMVGVGAGMAMAGKKPFLYAIASFATLRCFEQIRVDLCCMALPVTVVGVGAGFDYNTLGPTHHSTEDLAVMRTLPDLTVLSPSDSRMAEEMVGYCIEQPGPKYIRLDRTGLPLLYKEGADLDLEQGLSVLREGSDLCVVSTGRMVPLALELADALQEHDIETGVVDLFRIKPVNESLLYEVISRYTHIASLEEHFVTGGIGSVMLETLSNNGKSHPVFRFGIPDRFCREYGDRNHLRKLNGLDIETLTRSVLERMR